MPRVSRQHLLLLTWALVSLLGALVLLTAQRQSADDLKQRFADRAEVAAHFTHTYARDLLHQERRVAERELSGTVSSRDFAGVGNLFGYEAALLLDDRGRVMHALPAKSSLVGRDLTSKYAHLRAAAAGRTAVSNVVPSAAKGIPVVAFATPFRSARGLRVFSGAFDVTRTPIGAYLRNVTTLSGARVYLLDSAGAIVASNRTDIVGLKTVEQADPDLTQGLSRSATGETSDGHQYASRAVVDTSWRLVMSAPSAQLFEPILGARRYVPWMLWLGAVLGGLACALLISNLVASRAKLRVANDDLDRLASIDVLTGLYNRRQVQDALGHAVATAARHGQSLSVLMIDVDRFKSINDRYGHQVGDHVLRGVAEVLRGSVRAGDVVGRWGGEEFLAVLPCTDRSEAACVAERMREAVSSTAIVVDDRLIPVTVSIGVATRKDDDGDAFVVAADTAMYAAKAAGRNAVRTAV